VLEGCTGEIGKDFRCQSAGQHHASLYDCPGYRLPMEVEWEYAIRAGTHTAFYAGEVTPQGNNFTLCCEDKVLDLIGWYCHNSEGGWTHPGGLKAPNAWGLYDMSGNAFEWVNDPYEGTTPKGPLVDYGATLTKKNRALQRGGSASTWVGLHRSSSGPLDSDRNSRPRGVNLGFRLVRSLLSNDGGPP
jgi:formylglycine-generating enzyme required for sulfatase activity